ncbi:MAG: tRNA preQ1(34) S-adenosylmethionine ribosyltransferase-isomerase QueA [bacterium]
MLLNEFDYTLPEELIASFPLEKRDCSKLMVLNRENQSISHKNFYDVIDFFEEGDVLVLNDTKVIPARLIGKKETGAAIEVFLSERKSEKTWEVLIRNAKRISNGTIIKITEDFSAKAIERADNNKWLVEFDYRGDFWEALEKVGNIPLPPYIERNLADDEIKKLDFERYQTVYAKSPGAVAAPTAGLHFTDDLLDKLRAKGVKVTTVTLNVGLGTFRPVKCDNILDHKMDREFYEITEETANIINTAKSQNKRIIAVGTTSVRTLETSFAKNNELKADCGWSELFIYPGYKFNVIDRLITNFHLPKSTLIMLVSALAGKEFVFNAYSQAIAEKYRFYSYGDSMVVV